MDFRNTILEVKTLTFKEMLMLDSMYEAQKLVEKTKLALDKIGAILKYKKVQKLETKRKLMIIGAHNEKIPSKSRRYFKAF